MAGRIWFVNPRKRHHPKGHKRGCRCVVCSLRRNPRRRKTREHRPRVRVARRTMTLAKHSPWKGRIHKVNPFLKEYGMLALNPKHRRRRSGRHRVKGHMAGRRGHRYHVKGHMSNPHRRRHHYRRNPGIMAGIMQPIRSPITFLMDGSLGVLGAYFTVSIPNAFLPFPGQDIMSKVLRGLTRVATGVGIVWAARRFMPRSAHAVAVGAGIGAAGSFVLDLVGQNMLLGVGDTVQTPGQLFNLSLPGLTARASSPAPGVMGLAAYSRSATYAHLPGGASGMAAYSRSMNYGGNPGGASGMGAVYDSASRGVFSHRLYG